jgi:hypothetical protein
MAFTVNDFGDLKQLLVEHPEWRVELRRLLGNDDSRALPAILREVAEVQRELAESQRRSEQRLVKLEESLAQLAESQHKLAATEERILRRGGRMEKMLDRMLDQFLEMRYERRVVNYFARWLHRPAAVDTDELSDRL